MALRTNGIEQLACKLRYVVRHRLLAVQGGGVEQRGTTRSDAPMGRCTLSWERPRDHDDVQPIAGMGSASATRPP